MNCLLLRSLIINLPISEENKVASLVKHDSTDSKKNMDNNNTNTNVKKDNNESIRKDSEPIRKESENNNNTIRKESQDVPKRKVSRLNVVIDNNNIKECSQLSQ